MLAFNFIAISLASVITVSATSNHNFQVVRRADTSALTSLTPIISGLTAKVTPIVDSVISALGDLSDPTKLIADVTKLTTELGSVISFATTTVTGLLTGVESTLGSLPVLGGLLGGITGSSGSGGAGGLGLALRSTKSTPTKADLSASVGKVLALVEKLIGSVEQAGADLPIIGPLVVTVSKILNPLLSSLLSSLDGLVSGLLSPLSGVLTKLGLGTILTPVLGIATGLLGSL